MKKIFTLLTTLFLLTLLPLNTLSAQSLLFGQQHDYSVVLRGNGESVVYARLVFTNTEDGPLNTFTFEIPTLNVSEISIYQQILPPRCVEYDYDFSPAKCIEYTEPSYTSSGNYYSYYYGTTEDPKYYKVNFSEENNIYTLQIPEPLEPNKSGALIVAYAGKGYVSESFGLFSFKFETIKVNSRIEKADVSINVDSDLLLKGGSATVDYENTPSIALLSTGASDSFENKSLDSLVSRIGSYGSIQKSASNLASNESFNVEGEYSATWLRLYLSSIVIAVVVIALILVGAYFLNKYLKKREEKRMIELAKNTTSPMPAVEYRSKTKLSNVLGIALISDILLLVVHYLVTNIGILSVFTSYYSDPFLPIIGVILTFLTYILALILPAVIVSKKEGWRFVFYVLLAEVFWFLLFGLLYTALFQNGLINIIRYYNDVAPLPM